MNADFYVHVLLGGETQKLSHFTVNHWLSPWKAGFNVSWSRSWSISPIHEDAGTIHSCLPLRSRHPRNADIPKNSKSVDFVQVLPIQWSKVRHQSCYNPHLFASLPGRPHWRIPRISQVKALAIRDLILVEEMQYSRGLGSSRSSLIQ